MAHEHQKNKRVLASGVFDLLHLGHVKFLEEAKKTGGKSVELIVIIARDRTVEKNKRQKTHNVRKPTTRSSGILKSR
jgi:cytidyltransferase-like protein